ncbi:MAG: DegV family protein [Clostridia bacterium]|nr:DegV family protein [Clostridia bacterium]
MIKIITDLSADIPKEIAEELDIAVLPFYINYSEESILADVDYTPDMFYEKFKSTDEMPATSQATPGILEDMYREMGKEQPIIHVTIPANSSGIVNTALNISSRLNEEEGFDITVVDSSMYSYGIGVNVIEAAKMAKNGKSKDEIISFLKERFEKDRVYFIVDDLKYLQKGGRIKATTMVVSKVLDIKPILWSNDGMVEAFEKVKGLKRAISKMVDIVAEKMDDPENGTVYVLHADAPDKAKITAEMIKNKVSPKAIEIGKVGPIITCHAGVGVFGIYFKHKG